MRLVEYQVAYLVCLRGSSLEVYGVIMARRGVQTPNIRLGGRLRSCGAVISCEVSMSADSSSASFISSGSIELRCHRSCRKCGITVC